MTLVSLLSSGPMISSEGPCVTSLMLELSLVLVGAVSIGRLYHMIGKG